MRADARRLLWLAVLAAGCSGPQSALDPAGPSAASLHRLGVTMYLGATVVTLLVTALMLTPFVRRRPRPVNRALFLWGGGVALPLLTLTALVPYTLRVAQEMAVSSAPDRLAVDVTGSLYWWQMSYRRANGQPAVSANELRLPVGEPVEVFVRSTDVIHSFWVPRLAGKMDMIPGRTNRLMMQADRPGVFRGQCAEYCGLQHAMMAFDVLAMPRAEFDAWLAALARPAPEPEQPELRQGRDLFVGLGCGTCHTVRGVAGGVFGPDLTLVGGRRSLGAGTLPGGVGNLAAWIASAQHLKPGNGMPSYDQLEGPQLRALAAYLESLR